MKAFYGVYADPESAQRGVNRLRAVGVADEEITVISSEPFEEYEFSHRHKATWLYWIASLGGMIGLTFGSWLTYTTQTLWPIPTGGMPIVTLWPNLIIIFEVTMLGGILATVITLFVSAEMPASGAPFYDPAVSDGKILVGVANPPDASLATLEQALRLTGVERVQTVA